MWLRYTQIALWRRWLDCADAQADQSSLGAHAILQEVLWPGTNDITVDTTKSRIKILELIETKSWLLKWNLEIKLLREKTSKNTWTF